MVFYKKPVIDWETEVFQVSFNADIDQPANRLQALFDSWVKEREERNICTCQTKSFDLRGTREDRYLEIAFGWFCEKCLALLESRMAISIPEIEQVVIGSDKCEYPVTDLCYVEIGPKVVEFETGTKVEVPRFSIRRTTVTIGEFQSFAEATNLVTQAEKDRGKTYRDNDCLWHISERSRSNCQATCLTFEEARAYCQWAEVRLPTESEWMAAALVDDRIFDRRDTDNFLFGDDGKFRRSSFPNSLNDLGLEWVEGNAIPGKAVVRNGPQYVREIGWQKILHRFEWPIDSYDLMLGFRVVKSGMTAEGFR